MGDGILDVGIRDHDLRQALKHSPPQFTEAGRCRWCNRPLVEGQRDYCSRGCRWSFYHWWNLRPAYQRVIFIRDNFTCQKCGLRPIRQSQPWLPGLSELECDHIRPVSEGGLTVWNNLQTLCAKCNREKSDKYEPGGKSNTRD